ncbi:MAG TPA: hypothetical protein VMT30_06915 [Candidatus Saccharimonadia bacterium]|nr:hypothetical protein [Candidatus Saccharimonadia bacterium]
MVACAVLLGAGYIYLSHLDDKACNTDLLWTRASGLSSVESSKLRLTVSSDGKTITATPIGRHVLRINLFNLYPTADTGGFADKQQISPRVHPGDSATITLPASVQAVRVYGALC